VVAMTQLNLLTLDRQGGIVYNAAQGETVSYNGTDYLYTGPADVSVYYDDRADRTTYTATLRPGIKFSDGVEVTADDLIFTYYTLCDPSYDGQTVLDSYNILGLRDYQTQVTEAIYNKYQQMAALIYQAGRGNYTANDQYTENQYNSYWEKLDSLSVAAAANIVEYVANTYCTDTYVQQYFDLGLTAEEVLANEGMKVAFAMVMWGFGHMFEGEFTDSLEHTYHETWPTTADFYENIYQHYNGDLVTAWASESPYGEDPVGNTDKWFILTFGSQEMDGGIPNISGIRKVDQYTVEVVTAGYEASAVYQILGIDIIPMHYYGDPYKYDYENNRFGFDFGNLSTQRSRDSAPMGAGPYKFASYDGSTVEFTANENYFRGCPKTAMILFVRSTDVIGDLSGGKIDCANGGGSKSWYEMIREYNSNGELTGDVFTTYKVDNLGYGYIGMNADTVKVGNNAASEASKAFRKALATVIAVYRDTAYASYYGDAASVIQYPISNASWAAPQPADPGYRRAFSVDAEGNDLYTEGMSAEQMAAAALRGALSWFEKAGYTIENGMITAAPEGGKLEVTAVIPGDGVGDHPSFGVLNMAQEALASIGFTLIINDLSNTMTLWDMLYAGTQEIWCAAWGGTVDPDMYQVYHSSGIVGNGGSDSNHYHINDDELDSLILRAREKDDQRVRKQIYKECLDIIMDWAVEIPCYQRQNCYLFSSQRVNTSTLTPDITTYWTWVNDIELLEMN
nr:ABC transporter substrate-binding protein [Oscillospiraceae bacterium]